MIGVISRNISHDTRGRCRRAYIPRKRGWDRTQKSTETISFLILACRRILGGNRVRNAANDGDGTSTARAGGPPGGIGRYPHATHDRGPTSRNRCRDGRSRLDPSGRKRDVLHNFPCRRAGAGTTRRATARDAVRRDDVGARPARPSLASPRAAPAGPCPARLTGRAAVVSCGRFRDAGCRPRGAAASTAAPRLDRGLRPTLPPHPFADKGVPPVRLRYAPLISPA